MSKLKIIQNRIKCNHCKDVIESKTVHDYVSCKCGKVAVDGGKEYMKRSFTNPLDYTDLSITKPQFNSVKITKARIRQIIKNNQPSARANPAIVDLDEHDKRAIKDTTISPLDNRISD